MPDHDLSATTAIVTGASQGFGRGIATALARPGAQCRGRQGPRPARGTARRTRRLLHRGGRRRRRPDRGRAAHRRLPSAHPGAQRRRHPAAAADPAAHLADVQPQLGRRRPARVRVDPRGAARPAGSGQHRDHLVQRGGAARLAAVRRVRRGQGRHPVADRLRRRRSPTGRGSASGSSRCFRSSPRRPNWARCARPPTPPGGRDDAQGPGAHPGAGRARPSSSSSPAPARARTPTCSPPRA